MVWVSPEKQHYYEIRLIAPNDEKIFLDFNPLKNSEVNDSNPLWDDWHSYYEPLRVYKQDYEILLCYIKRIYPINDAFYGTYETDFDVCFDNWIGKSDWLKVIADIENDILDMPDDKKAFFTVFLKWLKTALCYTQIIVVEGNQ